MISRFKAGLFIVGACLALGAVNSATNIVFGSPLLDGGLYSKEQPQEQQTVSFRKDGWTVPVEGTPSVAYGVKGAMWASGHHTGIDYPVSTGTPVKAASAGEVVASNSTRDYGMQVVIRHEGGIYTQYAHLSRRDVTTGDTVATSQKIGLSGSTGNSTGPHLHFEVRTGPKYGSDIDPAQFLHRTDAHKEP